MIDLLLILRLTKIPGEPDHCVRINQTRCYHSCGQLLGPCWYLNFMSRTNIYDFSIFYQYDTVFNYVCGNRIDCFTMNSKVLRERSRTYRPRYNSQKGSSRRLLHFPQTPSMADALASTP